MGLLSKKIRVVPKSRGKLGKDWKRFYAVQFSGFLGWWTIIEKETMEEAKKFVEETGPFNKPNEIVYIYRK